MTTVGLRTYSVTAAELPLTIRVTAFLLPANRAIVGHPRVSKAGVLVERLVPEVVEDPAAASIVYEVPLPADPPSSFDISQTIDCWFNDDCPANAKYEIVITSTNGDEATTNVRVPTLNPGTANLAFRVAS